jgi:hypothetical protein
MTRSVSRVLSCSTEKTEQWESPKCKPFFFVEKNNILLFLSECLLYSTTLKQNVTSVYRISLESIRIACDETVWILICPFRFRTLISCQVCTFFKESCIIHLIPLAFTFHLQLMIYSRYWKSHIFSSALHLTEHNAPEFSLFKQRWVSL